MKYYLNNRSKMLLAAVALVVVSVTPQQSFAAGIGFRNDTPNSVIVQGASISGGMIRYGKRILIHPTRSAWDPNLGVGPRLIIITDPKQPKRILLRQTVPFVGQNLFFAIRVNTRVPARYPLMLVPQR